MKRTRNAALVLVLVLTTVVLVACSDGGQEKSTANSKPQTEAKNEQLSPGAQLYRDKNCYTCHGENGIKALMPNYPTIARQGEAYALQQMLDIQSGVRSNGQTAVMKALVQDIGEADFGILAAYLANELGGNMPTSAAVVDEESAGALLYKSKTCTACHGKDAKTPLLNTYPVIAGHSADYALQQMLDIKSGARDNGMAVKGMQGIMHLVSEEEMAQLADYIASLPR